MTEEIKNTTETATATVAAKPRTRTETIPRLAEGVELPAGYVPAYHRKRHGLLVLRATEGKGYLVFSTKTGESIAAANTRETSKLMSAIGKGLKSFSTAA
jgi:hypothetical protein